MDSKLHERFGELINSLSPEKRQELYSSLRAMEPSKREEVIAWYGAAEAMIMAHHPQLDFKHIEALILEED